MRRKIKIKCLNCKKLTNNLKFCSNKCKKLYWIKIHSTNICLWCGKKTQNNKFCSIECTQKYFKKYTISNFYNKKLQSKSGKIGGNRTKEMYPNHFSNIGKRVHDLHPNLASETMKRIHKVYPNLASESGKKGGKAVSFETHSKAGINAQKTLREKKLGYYNPETGRKGGKIGGPIGGKKSALNNKKRKLGLYNPNRKIQSMGGIASQKTLRENIRNLKYKSQYYDSTDEAGVSASLIEQFNYIPIEGKTLHIRMKNGEIDYLIENLKLFIEYHVRFDKLTFIQYYKKRRKILDKNGYKGYNLIVIK